MLEPGEQVDRYVVIEQIGSGGLGAVYRCEHVHLHTQHALKMLYVQAEPMVERLLQEGRAQARLRHPNVVRVTDIVVHKSQPCLVMEYVSGPTLAVWLSARKPSVDTALALFRGILLGTYAAHSKGLVHRDLSTANVLLAGGKVPKIADFGLVKTVLDGGMTRPGDLLGTPEFTSPEQVRDASTVGPSTDMWSLGCILYALVCGRAAFEGEHQLEVFNKVREADYPPPRDVVPDLPDAVVEVIDGLLVVDPDERIADCAEVLRRLYGPRALEEAAVLARATPAMADRRQEEGSSRLTTVAALLFGCTTAMLLVLVLALFAALVVLVLL